MKHLLCLLLCSGLFLHSCGPSQNITTAKKDGQLQVTIGGKHVLSYQYETLLPPAGVDTAFQRSGFIHPLKTLSGQVLTQIFPEDHYHHFGLWNPWTKVLFEGDTIDFWNIGRSPATVRFARFGEITNGRDEAVVKVLHEHIIRGDEGTKVALNEWQTIRVKRGGERHYFLDIISDYQCATDSPFQLLEYRYAGFGYRATAAWNSSNSTIQTSEGHSRPEIDGTRGRWVMVQGELGNRTGGLTIFSHPGNFNHPEPLRVWPPSDDAHDQVFINYAPTKTTDWLWEPGQTYRLHYRLVIFDGPATSEQADAWWQEFASE